MSDDERRKDRGGAHPLELVLEFLAQYFLMGTVVVFMMLLPAGLLTQIVFEFFGREVELEDFTGSDVLPFFVGSWVVSLFCWIVFSEQGREAVADVSTLFRRLSASRVVHQKRRKAARSRIVRRSKEAGIAAAEELSEQAERAGESSRKIGRIYLVIALSCLSLLAILVVLVAAAAHVGGEMGYWVAGLGGFVFIVIVAFSLLDLSGRAAELSALQLERYEAQHASEALAERGQAQAGSLSIAGDGVEGGLEIHDGERS